MKTIAIKIILGIVVSTLIIGFLFYLFIFLNPLNIYESNTLKWIPILIIFVSFYCSGKINTNTPIKLLPILFVPCIIFKAFNYFYFPFVSILILAGIIAFFVSHNTKYYKYKLLGWVIISGTFLFFLFNQPLISWKENTSYNDNGNLVNAYTLWDFTEKTNQKLPNHILLSKKNHEYDMADFKEKTYFITFWATWCAPCLQQKPELEKLKKEFLNNSQVEFIDISFDSNSKEKWINYIEANIVTGLQLISKNSKKTSRELNFSGIPMYFIVDSNGTYFKYRSFEIAQKIIRKNNL